MPKTILLADDSVTIQKVVGISFANEDVVLLTVDNGDDAVARAKEARPDLVLADVAMPGRDGYAVCEAVKSDPTLRHVPVLLLSGTFESFDEERARQVGADGHVTKPFEAQALVDRVNDLLARSEASRPVGGAETTVLVSAQPSAADAFEFFDDELATPEPSGSATTVLIDRDEEEPLSIEPVANDPLALERAIAVDLEPSGEPMAIASFEDEPIPADGHATMLFDGDLDAAPSPAPPPVPRVTSPAVEFGTPRASRTQLSEPSAGGGATRLLETEDPADALGFGLDAAPERARSFRDTAALELEPADVDPSDDLFAREIETVPAPSVATAPRTAALRSEPPASGTPELEALRGELRGHLEKVAWEAFGDLSERIVRETVARVEAIAWEVIPQMAEALIREEIRKLQSEE